MGKNRYRNRHQPANHVPSQTVNAGVAATPNAAPDTAEAASTRIDALHVVALDGATDLDLERVTGGQPQEVDLLAAARKAQEIVDLCTSRESRARAAEKLADEERAHVEKKARELDVFAASIKREEAAFAGQRADIPRQSAQLKALEADLLTREESLQKRELDAEAGFAALRRGSLQRLEVEARVLLDELSAARTRIAEERSRWDSEAVAALDKLNEDLQRRRAEHAEVLRRDTDAVGVDLGEERAELSNERRVFEAERAALEKTRRRLELDRQDVEEYRRDLDHRVEQRAAGREEALNHQVHAVEERLNMARAQRDALDAKLRARDEADRRFGHKTPEEVLSEIAALTKELESHKTALATRPNADAITRLQTLESEREHWSGEQLRLVQDSIALKNELARSKIAVTEIETLRDQKAALETGRDLLHAALEELRKDVNERIRRSDGVSSFPACSQMDRDGELQTRRSLEDDVSDLAAFTKDLQHRIAYDPETQKVLYYSLRDIRCFLGGLAMSRLHLLQGISGTGKTSLPIAFARAVGAGVTLVEVQAGWRDRQDLIGHFNAFERRFYESEFLQALYRAQCPKFAEAPYLIVLDEVNLSHPEQYFADMLSALEQARHLQKLDLMTAPVDPAPTLLKNGRTLPIPENVWFVGTANHDETTKDFADKTYDRAHVMELPRHREEFKAERRQSRSPIALESLLRSFSKAQEQHSGEAARAYKFIDEEFADILGRQFRIGWGNRLERQVKDFAPVVMAAGGSIGEATDHILATKLLRKIRDRHDTRAEDLFALEKRITDAWPRLDPKAQPERSRAIIRDELRRLGTDDEPVS